MKILLVNKFHYIKGGSETYYFSLGKMLMKRGCNVIYFSMKDPKNFECQYSSYFVDNVDFNEKKSIFAYLKMGIKMLYSFEAKKKFKSLIIKEQPDIIHLNIFQSQLTGSIIDVAKKFKIPIVYTAHDLKSICPNYKMLTNGVVCEACLYGNYLNCILKKCIKDSALKSLLATVEAYAYKLNATYKKLNLIITPSKFYENKILQSGIANCKVIYLPNFLPCYSEYSIKKEKGNYFLYFGRLSEEKGLFTLIKAYKEAEVTIPLYIIGSGPIENELNNLIKSYRLEHSVFLLGYKQGEELKNIIYNSLCVVLPSEWYENGPYSIMESLAMGKPVIVSNIGGLPEIVTNGVNGYVVESHSIKSLSDALIKMEQLDIEKYEEFSKKAKQIAQEKFSWVTYTDKLLELYKDLLQQNDKVKI